MSANRKPLVASPTQDRELEKVLSGPAFQIDEIACTLGAKILGLLRLPTANQLAENRTLNQELLFRLSLAAICHQMNWDFLSLRLTQQVNKAGITSEYLSELSARDIEKLLEGYQRPERIRAKERALLLRDLGQKLLKNYEGSAVRLLEASGNRLQGHGGFLERLDEFTAFAADPLRKKSNVLIHEVVRDSVVNFIDEDKIEPAIDYHIMRLYLRTGRVVPLHSYTAELLKQDSIPRPRLVRLLRESVGLALSTTSLFARLSIPVVNTLEWQIGREICDRIDPKCDGPPSTAATILGSTKELCPNSGYCMAFANSSWRSLREPDHKNSFY